MSPSANGKRSTLVCLEKVSRTFQMGEVVVRVSTALTCGTDLKTLERGHPKIPLPVPIDERLIIEFYS